MHWKCPFQVDYVLTISGKTTIFRINMLKKYEESESLPVQQVSVITKVDQGPLEGNKEQPSKKTQTRIPFPSLLRTQSAAHN